MRETNDKGFVTSFLQKIVFRLSDRDKQSNTGNRKSDMLSFLRDSQGTLEKHYMEKNS